jgi:ATP/maltotriose-dependent transcriptional regulator MalT
MDERRHADEESASERLLALVTHLSGRQHRMIDYLTSEVLSRQPNNVQRFLLVSLVFEGLCPSHRGPEQFDE